MPAKPKSTSAEAAAITKAKADKKAAAETNRIAAGQRKQARLASKLETTTRDIAIEVSGDQKPLSFKRYPDDTMVVILSNGQKHRYDKNAVLAAVKKLK